MSHRYRIGIAGFTAFERSALESFLRLSGERSPAYACATDLRDSVAVIVDADSEAAVESVREAGLLELAVAVGARERAGVARQLPRPINVTAILRALDQLAPQLERRSAALRGVAVEVEAPAPERAAPARSFKELRRQAVRSFTGLVGPLGDSLALRIEQARNSDDLRRALELAHQAVVNTRGKAAAARFAGSFLER